MKYSIENLIKYLDYLVKINAGTFKFNAGIYKIYSSLDLYDEFKIFPNLVQYGLDRFEINLEVPDIKYFYRANSYHTGDFNSFGPKLFCSLEQRIKMMLISEIRYKETKAREKLFEAKGACQFKSLFPSS